MIVSKPLLDTSDNINPTKLPYNQRKRLGSGGVVYGGEKEKARSGFGVAWLPQQPVAVESGRNRHSTVTATASAKATSSNSVEGQFQTGAGHVKRTLPGISII